MNDIVESVTEAPRAPFNQIGVAAVKYQFSNTHLAILEDLAAEMGITNQEDAILAAAKKWLDVQPAIRASEFINMQSTCDAYRDELNKPREDWQTY